MTQKPRPDPEQIADRLVERYGLQGAASVALDQTILVQTEQDLYALSIWREVKQAIRNKAIEDSQPG